MKVLEVPLTYEDLEVDSIEITPEYEKQQVNTLPPSSDSYESKADWSGFKI